MQWFKDAARVLHRAVPYLALALTLVGQHECAAALQALVAPLVV